MDEEHTFQVVVGVDGSPQSLLALEWAVTEARLRHGQLRVVTGWQFPAVAAGMESLSGEFDAFQRVAQRLQARALQEVSCDGVAVSREIHQGPAAGVLLTASKDADLLVVGSRGHGGFANLLLGSVSNQIAHHATCPVLIIRPKHPARAAI